MNVGPLDLAILVAYMAGMVVLGSWLGRGARDVAEYAVGSRDLPWWLILFSIIATETSAVTFLSIPGFAYERDFTWIQIALGFLAGRFAVAFLLLPQYFRGTLFTSYEVLHRRFGGATKQTASALFILTRSLADGLRLFLSALVLQEMTGISIPWAVTALGVTTIVYTYLGGMRAVLWTDLIQFFLYLAGALIALGAILARLPGGWDQLVAMGQAAGKLRAFNPTLDLSEPYGLWAGLVGGAFVALASHGVDQLMVQRYLSARGLPEARRAVWVSGLVAVAQFALFLLIGIGLWSFYQLHPPAVPFDRPDRVFARFILDELPTGLVGLLLGAIFAAAMTSSLNSCATVAVNDLYLPGREVSPERQMRLTRILTALFGAVQIAVGIAGQWLRSSIVSSVLGIAAFTTGIVLGLFFLGMYTRRVGQTAALAGLVAGLAGMTWIFFATPLAWPWYALAGSLLTVAAGLVASQIGCGKMRTLLLAVAVASVVAAPFAAQAAQAAQAAGSKPAKASESPLAKAAAALPLRSLGPGLMSGRISDVEVHPTLPGVWYVAAGSGGVWKTTNAGTTWTPIFEDQASYSIGEVTLDPTNPDVVWVGTGENVSGRHVGWGDGVYRSRDAGRTWQRMGLPRSEHIGRILVDPRDGNRVLVAAEGPLWAPGGERGVYRSTDGGATWTPVLQIDEDTGVTDLEFDPSNPDVVYAASYQRRRHVWGFLGGGPGSGVWKSGDNGKTWRRLKTGLPSGDMGKIGLAVTPADPSLVYATIEAGEEERGFYRSRDRGESWEKRNRYISGGTGPHYYQEIEASPLDAARVYQMDVFLHVTRDGGATMETLETGHDKHSDNHALWIDPADGNHFLVGTDAGLYESFDEGRTFRHFPNLPVSQFYKVALSNREPFYDILAGAQDLGTLHGPSRTLNEDGIRNQDWYVPLGADGYGVAFDPGDPDLLYLMWQEGVLFRRDRRNDEALRIRPQPAEGDAPERWNWDSPLLVSPHRPGRIYYGSQRVWRSDDRGGSWTPISGDLTDGRNRYEQKFFGRVWSVDALHDTGAMSKYATTTAISESPLREGTLVVGTDDGLVQVTTDGGRSWRRAAAIPGLPALSFVNDVEMSLHDADTLYVVADNHKSGDFKPYIFESTDLGRTWRSMAGDLPVGEIVWAVQQDHVRPELFFAGTERGLYFSLDRGTHWLKLGGLPTIPFRDVKLHRRDNDLVGASFGRGIYVLDDYTPLRDLSAGAAALAEDGVLFPVRDAWWFVPYQPGQAPGRPELGTDDFTTPNPPHGALFTYFLREAPASAHEARKASEKALREKGADVPFPGFDRLRAEALETAPKVLLIVSDAAGRKVRWIEGPAKEGLHRVSWDLRGSVPDTVVLDPPAFRSPWDPAPVGPLVAPGRYSAELVVVSASGVRTLGAAQSFEVKPVPNLPPGTDPAAVAAFQGETAEAARRLSSATAELGRVKDQLRRMRATLGQTPKADLALYGRLDAVGQAVAELERRLDGDPARQRLSEPDTLSIGGRIGEIRDGHWHTRQMPTATQRRGLEIARAGLDALERDLKALIAGDLAKLEEAFSAAGAPWTPGRRVP